MIRNLERKDMKRLAKLYEQFWNIPSDVGRMRELYDRLCDRDEYIMLGAEEDGRLAGAVSGIVCEALYGQCAPFLVLENMVVDTDFKRRGIGKALLGEMEKRAREKGCCQMMLAESGRQDARGLYKSAGFRPAAGKGYIKKL